jgi:tripartite-type tricarboxylate transporter receptor subunit TctC
MSLKQFARCIVGALAVTSSGLALGQAAYPSKPLVVISAFPPGTPNDFIARLVAERFQAVGRQPLIVENRPGAGGNIGAEAVTRAAPDGYTLLATVDTVVTVNPVVYSHLTFKAGVDLQAVLYLANTAQTLVCHPSVPVKSVSEFIAYAKTHPMAYASGGVGVPGHLAAELFLAAVGVKMTHVPYKGPAPATQDVLAGMVPCGFLATPVVMPHVKAGRLNALAVTAPRRSPIAPDVPTMREAGVPEAEAAFGEMLLVPKGTPASTIAWVNETFSAILQLPEVRERMLAADLVFQPNTPAQAAQRLQQETAKWKPMVERLGLRVD